MKSPIGATVHSGAAKTQSSSKTVQDIRERLVASTNKSVKPSEKVIPAESKPIVSSETLSNAWTRLLQISYLSSKVRHHYRSRQADVQRRKAELMSDMYTARDEASQRHVELMKQKAMMDLEGPMNELVSIQPVLLTSM